MAEQALSHPSFCLFSSAYDADGDDDDGEGNESEGKETCFAGPNGSASAGNSPCGSRSTTLLSLGWAALALSSFGRVWVALSATTQGAKRVQSERVRAEELLLTSFAR